LPLMAPAIDSWDRNARAAGDLSHALPVWWAHSLKDLLPHSGAVGPFHGRRLGPLVDESNRVDNFADSGGVKILGKEMPGTDVANKHQSPPSNHARNQRRAVKARKLISAA